MEKLGITLNLRTERGKELLAELVRLSNAVTENFAAGVMERLGFGYERLEELRPDVVYVSNCGFGHTGPYQSFKSWGPIAQAVSGLTHTSGLPRRRSRPVGATPTWTTPVATSWPSPCSPRSTTSAARARASGSIWPASKPASP